MSFAADTSGQKRGILIVDDHPLVREWLANLINQQPDLVVCGEAANAAEARNAAAKSQPAVAIVDISLRDSSGLELIKDLKIGRPGLVVLVLSMHDEAHYAERALLAGAKGYIMKRETTTKVVEAIRCVLEGKFYLSDTMAQAVTRQYVQGRTLAVGSPVERLSDRELAVFEMLGEGHTTRQIADNLGVGLKSVQAYCARIKEKLNLATATELMRDAVRHQEATAQTDPFLSAEPSRREVTTA